MLANVTSTSNSLLHKLIKFLLPHNSSYIYLIIELFASTTLSFIDIGLQ